MAYIGADTRFEHQCEMEFLRQLENDWLDTFYGGPRWLHRMLDSNIAVAETWGKFDLEGQLSSGVPYYDHLGQAISMCLLASGVKNDFSQAISMYTPAPENDFARRPSKFNAALIAQLNLMVADALRSGRPVSAAIVPLWDDGTPRASLEFDHPSGVPYACYTVGRVVFILSYLCEYVASLQNTGAHYAIRAGVPGHASRQVHIAVVDKYGSYNPRDYETMSVVVTPTPFHVSL
jgi:hypothetical protein